MLIFRSEERWSEEHRLEEQLEEHRSEEHVDRWCKAWRMPRGATLSVEQAWKLADAWYRDRMTPDWRRRSMDEAHELFSSLGLTSEFWRFS